MIAMLSNSPIEKIILDHREFYIKRDDKLEVLAQCPWYQAEFRHAFSGNKARKFYYYLENEFEKVNKLVSYGSIQANSLFSFSALAKLKGWQFDYYVKSIPGFLKETPKGNYHAALNNGANVIEVGNKFSDEDIEKKLNERGVLDDQNVLFIPEGGRSKHAETGINILAEEIIKWMQSIDIIQLNVFLPSGTGTTAVFLQKRFIELAQPIKVITCPCVGDMNYLTKQFSQLIPDKTHHPTVVTAKKKYHFGKLYRDFFFVWKRLLQDTNIEFDLLYDPLGWLNLLKLVEEQKVLGPILYIHQGGVLGNETMLPRYRRKYPNS